MLVASTSPWTTGSPGRLDSSPALFADLELWGAGVSRVTGLHRPGSESILTLVSGSLPKAACGQPGTHS